MKTFINLLSAGLLALSFTLPINAEAQIKLSGRKDLVVTVDSRAKVLEVGSLHLSEKSEDFLVSVSSIENPFSFEQEVAAVAGNNGDPAGVAPPAVINYDDASVLRAVAQNFAKQVRGTLARGDTSFLQLKGGSMINQGTSFPVTIPQAQGQTFTVTISAITSDSYTLTLGDATQTISLNAQGTGQGALRME